MIDCGSRAPDGHGYANLVVWLCKPRCVAVQTSLHGCANLVVGPRPPEGRRVKAS
eukprot:NODE_6383_length_632_cov_2.240137_g5437_i0.p5 GENE.NODE_6383_length_632_cov_2.240137_g5437_i0~~NODE_6383_length_632_cov_2.240137_g5437_i0.p5  ORF type:complete len:55 (-),score=1.92 NODE_6383_length_632_cov_2.240137_g5437_i0:449-613(-)